jgi:hypothetical protein
MNTWLWGPPLWRVLHTVSFSPVALERGGEVTAFLQTLKTVLPCVFCRDSYASFVTQLEGTYAQTVQETIADGKLATWMYDLHNLVSDKLDLQSVTERVSPEALTTMTATGAYRCRRITFQCLVKRCVVRPCMFCPDDVWDVLLIFALNFPEPGSEGFEKKRNGYATFFGVLPGVLEIAGAAPRLVQSLRQGASRMQDESAMTSAHALFDWVARQRAVYEGVSVSAAQIARERGVIMDTATAQRCQHGSCV